MNHLNEWLNSIRKEEATSAAVDFGNDIQMRETLTGFFHALSKKMSRQQLFQLSDLFTEEIKTFIQQALYEDNRVIE
jgi:hypothetical protein